MKMTSSNKFSRQVKKSKFGEFTQFVQGAWLASGIYAWIPTQACLAQHVQPNFMLCNLY